MREELQTQEAASADSEEGAVPGAWGEGKGQGQGSEGAMRDLTGGGSTRPVTRATRKQVGF